MSGHRFADQRRSINHPAATLSHEIVVQSNAYGTVKLNYLHRETDYS